MIRWLQVTSGRGPDECCLVVARVVRCIVEEAADNNLKTHILETVPGEKPDTFKSALIALEGDNLAGFVEQWTGTVQWIGYSPFRPNHRRKNWFVGIDTLNPPESLQWSEKDIRFETMRASGPGGQHVNKTETAVRATHVPTGLSATAQEERSQYLNKKLALTRLAELINQEENKSRQKDRQKMWGQHNTLERGNPVRVYEGKNFRLKT